MTVDEVSYQPWLPIFLLFSFTVKKREAKTTPNESLEAQEGLWPSHGHQISCVTIFKSQTGKKEEKKDGDEIWPLSIFPQIIQFGLYELP